jgi:hypothetical protein
MSEPTDLLEVAFQDLREAVMPYTRLAGVDEAHATVRRRRRTRLAAVGLVVLPLVVFAVFRTANPGAPVVTITPGMDLFPTQSASARPVLRPLGAQSVPAWMFNGTVDVPDFGDPGCAKGQLRFFNGTWVASPSQTAGFTPSLSFDEVGFGDVTGDGEDDVLVVIRCLARAGQARPIEQVAAYSLSHTGDGTLLGQVVRGSAAEDLSSPQVQPDGSVRVTVRANPPASTATNRWRVYRWDSGAFVLSGQPVDVPATPPTTLNLTVTPNVAPGTLTSLDVTVHNGGTQQSDYYVVTFSSHAPLVLGAAMTTTSPPVGCDTPDGCRWDVRYEPVAAGQSATATFTVLFTGAGNSAGPVSVKVVGCIRGAGEQPNADATNQVTVPLGP